MPEPVRLHIGGEHPMPGWCILNAVPGPHVDIVGNATDLDMFETSSVDAVYASHILEHLDNGELLRCLGEIHRVLKPGCRLLGGVPDLEILCRLWLENRDYTGLMQISGIIFGGHINEYDVHHAGFDLDMMTDMLAHAGFGTVYRMDRLGLLTDQTTHEFNGTPISLNFIAEKAN